MAKQNLGGTYANMDFPPYEFREYPKHIQLGNGAFEVANNASEEESIRSRLQLVDNNPRVDSSLPTSDPEREILIARAHQLGVAINRMWSLGKLKTTIAEAEGEVDNLPAEEAESEDKEALIARAKSLGINARNNWSVSRLKNSIASVETDGNS